MPDGISNCPSLGDIDGDGDLEIFQSTTDEANNKHKLYAWHYDGTEVSGWPVWLPDVSYGTVTIGDIDMDGKTEIAKAISPGAFLWDIDGIFEEKNIQWGTFMHDARRTGCFESPLYEDSRLYPRIDIKCNGQDDNVIVPSTDSVRLTFGIVAGDQAGTPYEVWVIGRDPLSCRWCYDPGSVLRRGGPYAYYTGGLIDMSDTILDKPLMVGRYRAAVAVDTDVNGIFDKAAIPRCDKIFFEVVP